MPTTRSRPAASPARGRGRVRTARHAVPPRASRALLPDAGLVRTTPRTPSRTPCSPPGAGSVGSGPRRRSGPGSTAWRPTPASTRRRTTSRRPQAAAPPPPGPAPPPNGTDPVTWLQPYPDALLDALPEPSPGPESPHRDPGVRVTGLHRGRAGVEPRGRAVLVLRDVMGFSGGRGRRRCWDVVGRRCHPAEPGPDDVADAAPVGPGPAGDRPRTSAMLARRFADAAHRPRRRGDRRRLSPRTSGSRCRRCPSCGSGNSWPRGSWPTSRSPRRPGPGDPDGGEPPAGPGGRHRAGTAPSGSRRVCWS